MHTAPNTAQAERSIPPCLPCRLVFELSVGTSSFAVELTDLSTEGVLVRATPEPPHATLVMTARLQPFTRIRLSLEVEGNGALHEARGFVVWQVDFGVRIEFIDVTPALAELIARLEAAAGNDAALLARVKTATLFQPR